MNVDDYRKQQEFVLSFFALRHNYENIMYFRTIIHIIFIIIIIFLKYFQNKSNAFRIFYNVTGSFEIICNNMFSCVLKDESCCHDSFPTKWVPGWILCNEIVHFKLSATKQYIPEISRFYVFFNYHFSFPSSFICQEG